MASAGAQNAISGEASDASSAETVADELKKDELSVTPDTASDGSFSIFFDKNGKEVKHRIFSVPHFGNTFPDQQDVQIVAASKHGVAPVQNREEAEKIIKLVEPVKNLFGAIFFVSVGMLVDPNILVEYAVPILALVAAIRDVQALRPPSDAAHIDAETLAEVQFLQ